MEKPGNEDGPDHYAAMLDSVRVIEALEAAGDKDDETRDMIQRNKAYLKVMLLRQDWADHDMTQIQAAVG